MGMVVRIAQEADYRVDIDRDVYGPYNPTLTFGHIMRNDSLLVLLATGASISWLFFICVGGVVVGMPMAVGACLLASAAQKLLTRSSVNL
jgi:hypothetical protein